MYITLLFWSMCNWRDIEGIVYLAGRHNACLTGYHQKSKAAIQN